MDLLNSPVHLHNAPLEERNEQGLTPLYNALYSNWSDGALLLLELGADVHNAESRPVELHSTHPPLMHLAMRTGNKPLVRELVKRGTSIISLDSNGNQCVHLHGFPSPDDLFQCDSLTECGSSRTNLLKDLFFVINIASQHGLINGQVESFIRRQPGCLQSKLLKVFAAHYLVTVRADDVALHYLRKSTEFLPCQLHDHTEEEERAPRSVFADILNVEEHPLPDTATTNDGKLAICIHALLAIEEHMPEGKILLLMGNKLHKLLLARGEEVTAFCVLWRLTTVRLLSRDELIYTVEYLFLILRDEKDPLQFPLCAIVDILKIIQKYLSSLNVAYSKLSTDFSSLNNLIFATRRLLRVLNIAMKGWYSQDGLATAEQLQDFTSLVKDIFRHFPSTYCQGAFHILMQNVYSRSPSPASMIKDLVVFSAEVRGTVRQVNSPFHLLSDEHGNTPLHCLAMLRSREELVEDGLLQCFLDHGAHLCSRNNQGRTVQSILVERGMFTEGELLPSLQCLAAAAFMRNRPLRQSVQNCRSVAVRNFLLDH